MGDEYRLSGVLPCDEYSVGERTLRIKDGISYSLVLAHSGDGISIDGMMHADVEGVCDRCLEPALLKLDVKLDDFYLFHEADIASDDEQSSDADMLNVEHTLDLAAYLKENLVAQTPFVILCSEHCKGICPRCGKNLNEGTCECEVSIDESASNPFGVLKDLRCATITKEQDRRGEHGST